MYVRRRSLLATGGAALLVATYGGAIAGTLRKDDCCRINLSDFGGTPNASPDEISNAFNLAFSELKEAGGGILHVDPGVYDLGKRGNGIAVTVSDLRNVRISAYGAQLTMTTTGTGIVTPVFFRFTNPNNITIAGMSFKDFGTDLNINWFGAVCIVIESSRACSGFKTVDVVADNVVRLLMASQPDTGRYTFEGFDLHGTVKNAYYGAGCIFNGANSRVNLTVHNVRRAFIGYGLRNWDLTINASADGMAPGSNGLVELAADHRGYADTVKVNLIASGNLKKYAGLVTFYLQGPRTASTYIRNVKANVTLNNVSDAAGAVFLFPYEAPGFGGFASSTISTWEKILLNAHVVGSYSGIMIKNPSVSTGKNNSIYVHGNIVAHQKMTTLPDYFKVAKAKYKTETE